MPFTYRLSRRLAVLRAPLCLTALLAAAACAGDMTTADDALTDDSDLTVVLSPSALTLDVDQTNRFLAYGRTGQADSVALSVQWSATGGTISADGVFRASQAGTYKVVGSGNCRRHGCADTSVVIVVPPQPTLVEVVVTPASVTLANGAAQSFSAAGRLSDNSTVPIGVTWTATGGAVDAAGRYVAGSTPGSFRVVARSSSVALADTALVTVTAPSAPPPPPPPPTLAGECGTPRTGWIWCDDFEQDRLARYFEYDNAGGSFTRAAGVGNASSYGMRVRFAAGQVSAGALHVAVGRTPQSYFRPVDAGTANYRELYWRMYVRNQAGWTGGGGYKLSRAFSFASTTSWAQSMIAHIWSGTGADQDYLIVDPASGTDAAGTLLTTAYNDFANLRWLGLARGKTPLFDASHVGQWQCVEAHARLNDAGQSNVLLEFWLNGEAQASRTGLNFVGAFSAYGLNAVYFESYWNGGSPRAQERYFDNIVVSTQRIGC
jgi:hypothetical protein